MSIAVVRSVLAYLEFLDVKNKGSYPDWSEFHVLFDFLFSQVFHLMESMFFREVPDWKWILKAIEQFEKAFHNLE